MIFAITHKIFDDSIIDKKHYIVLHVGGNNNCKEIYLRDDTGDNISEKNSSYCELTGLYWIWKNYKEPSDKITGLVHYRRYFTTRLEDLLYTYFNIKPHILNYSKIEKCMGSVDVIVPSRVRIFRTVKEFYSDLHIGEDLDITRNVISIICPDYLEAFDKVMNSHYFYYANMMICKREYLNYYCEWLFKLMPEIESRIDFSKYMDSYQSRVLGFVSERLLQVWLIKNKVKIAEYPVFNVEEKRINIFKKNLNRVQKVLKKYDKNKNKN